MSSGVDNRTKVPQRVRGAAAEATPGRRRDAQASRQALLEAAAALFDERGYDRTTVREIGERAGVDAALIARYFGSKEGLYLASLRETSGSPLPQDPVAMLAAVLERAETRGLGPLGLAMLSPALTDAMRSQVHDVMRERILEPLVADLEAREVPDAALRAELLLALAMGVVLTRANGTLPTLQQAPLADVVVALEPLVAALQDPA